MFLNSVMPSRPKQMSPTPPESSQDMASFEKTEISSERPTSTPQRSLKQETETDDTDNRVYPTGITLVLIFVSIFATTFLVALDGTIIATAIPTITAQFSSLDQYAWYNSGYLLATCCFQLPFGRAYTLLNIKWVYIFSIVIFMIGSLVCATAPSSTALIVGRAIAGAGGSGIFSGGFILIAKSIPLRKRSIYTGFLGAAFVVASVVGPILGGALTTHVSWGWCFYINLPIGGLAVAVALFFIPKSLSPKSADLKEKTWFQILKQFDPIGTLFLLPSVACLLLALQWGGTEYAWSDGRVIATLTVFGVLIIIWIGLQIWQGDDATVPPSVIMQRSVAGSTLYIFCGSAAFTIAVYYLPIWFQAIKQDDAETSGIHIIALTISVIVSSVAAGGTVVAIGYYTPFLILGSIVSSIGAGLLMTLSPNSGTGTWLGYEILFGAGIGMSLELCNIACQTVLPESKVPAAISLSIFARSLGGALSISIAQNVFEQQLRKSLSRILPEGDLSVVSGSGATNLIENVQNLTGGDEEMVRTVVGLYNGAVVKVFLVAVVLTGATFAAALPIEWKSVKKVKMQKKMDVEQKQEEDTSEEKLQDEESGVTAAI